MYQPGSTQTVHKTYTTPTGTVPSRGIFMRQYRHGGREDQGLVHVAALLTDSLFLYKGRVIYDPGREIDCRWHPA